MEATAAAEMVVLELQPVGPEDARLMLRGNEGNRSVRQSVVREYAGAMERGEWVDGVGEAVLIAPDGMLLNGQHRLLAVVMSGATVVLPVLRGALDGSQLVADSGVRRNFADALTWAGITDARTLSSAVRYLWQVEHGMVGRSGGDRGRVTTPQLMAFFDTLDKDRLRGHLGLAARVDRNVGISRTLALALTYWFETVDPDEAVPFMEKVADGEGLSSRDPVFALRRIVREKRGRGSGAGRLDPREAAALAVKAFNYWRAGREVGVLYWRGGGSKAEQFPKLDPPQAAGEAS